MVAQSAPRQTGETITEAGFRRQIEAIKSSVCISHVASEYGEFKRTGTNRLIGRCLNPSHEDRTPSMTVYTDRQKFRCYSCGERGDVVDLEMLVNPGIEIQEALVALSIRYSVSLPERPKAWFGRQERQRSVREIVDEERIKHISKLVFRLLFVPWLRRLPADDIEADTESARQASRRIAQMVYASRREV